MRAMRSHMSEVPTSSVRDVRSHVTEIVGTSDESVDAAIDDGVARAGRSAGIVEWVEVTGVHSNVLGGMSRYSVGLRLGLRPAA